MSKVINIEQRKKIIKTAFRLFLEKGYEAVTTREIAAECGMGRALLHYYFNKKEQLFSLLFVAIAEWSYLYLVKSLNIQKFDYSFKCLQYRLFYATMDYSPQLADMHLIVMQDGSLLLDGHISMYDWCEKTIGFTMTTEEQIITTFMIGGTSQLILQKKAGVLNLSYKDIAELAMRSSYTYLGYDKDNIQANLTKCDELITPSFVRGFIEYLDAELDLGTPLLTSSLMEGQSMA